MKIYVGNLSKSYTDAQLNDLALPFGVPDSASIERELAGGASKGFGFVEYATDEQARAAITGLDGKAVEDRVLEAREANVAAPCEPTSLLFPLG